tara:strand:- start:1206 stop:2036 length:831 start_codon:yes stop_codon:yes gene_type:complete
MFVIGKEGMPQYEKILVGPSMMFCEMMTGGYYMETLKIMKQSSMRSYGQIVNHLWNKHRFRGFYLGLVPWGLIQTSRGLPVLFVQSETMYLMKNNTDMTDLRISLFSGILSGMAQAIFVTPTQRFKTMMMTHPAKSTEVTSFGVVREAYRKGGINSFFNGLKPMLLRRGIDWGLRFLSFHFIQDAVRNYRGHHLSSLDLFFCGFGAGILSSVSAPIDTCIAESQKHSNINRGFMSVIKDIYQTYGFKGFTRGWRMRVLHSCYHTSWVCGMGNILFP